MTNIKEILEQLKEINQWRGYMNKERFISYAKAKYLFDDKEAESMWKVWDYLATLNLYQLEKQSEAVILTAMDIAREAYEAVCNGGHIHWRENKPNTPKWKVYYRIGEEGEMQHIKLNLLEKEDVIKYALLLQQEGVEICHRVDFYNTVEVRHGDKREEIDVYDGDIIFCTDKDRFTWGEKSGAYVCIDGCYKRLMYTPGRGYICRGEPDYEQNRDGKDCRYNDYVFNSYDRRFQIVGNIFVDNSVLNEKKEEKKEETK